MNENQKLRKVFCSSGKCMAAWCTLNTIHNTCRYSKYHSCEEWLEMEKEDNQTND